jgi:hypothetical protein
MKWQEKASSPERCVSDFIYPPHAYLRADTIADTRVFRPLGGTPSIEWRQDLKGARHASWWSYCFEFWRK